MGETKRDKRRGIHFIPLHLSYYIHIIYHTSLSSTLDIININNHKKYTKNTHSHTYIYIHIRVYISIGKHTYTFTYIIRCIYKHSIHIQALKVKYTFIYPYKHANNAR